MIVFLLVFQAELAPWRAVGARRGMGPTAELEEGGVGLGPPGWAVPAAALVPPSLPSTPRAGGHGGTSSIRAHVGLQENEQC